MKLDLLESTETWGSRMAKEAKAILARWPSESALEPIMRPVFERIAAVPTPDAQRFRRRDAVAVAPPPPPPAEPVEEGRPLPVLIRERLSQMVPAPAAEALRVHTDERADQKARAHHADAVTTGTDVSFRKGRFQPDDHRGFALLAHEATHVAASLQPNVAGATTMELAKEERAAHATEARVLRHEPTPIRTPLLASPTPAPAAPAPRAVPMAADSDRILESATPSGVDHEELRRNLFRDLLNRLRTDYERGG